jgi:glucose uptake protein GlcU
MSVLLSVVTVLAWGTWIPLAQIVAGVPQRSRTFYVTLGNVIVAGAALAIGGGSLAFGWRTFWLPLAGGVVWTIGNFAAFRATETIGLARAAGTWTPLNIATAFVWGALLFGELAHFGPVRIAVLIVGFVGMSIGVVIVVSSTQTQLSDQAGPSDPRGTVGGRGRRRAGLLWAVAAGLLWGSYFVPAQWSKAPAHVANFPLAVGALFAGLVLAATAGERVRVPPRVTTIQVAAGFLFGIGNVALLSLVARVGTGVGFTIAQLSLLVNASIGIWVFKVPPPGTRPARIAIAGIMVAGVSGCAIGALR